ncbi:TonB-dependent receptor [Opitutaceae bacterium EW11]|nr:TonB-dependent receptor [Opitutaceae bacterium EW11]
MRFVCAEEYPHRQNAGGRAVASVSQRPRARIRPGTGLCLLVLTGVFATGSWAQDAAGRRSREELKALSIEDLVQQEIVTASRRAESWTEVPSGVVVIGGDEIRRSGANSLPAALRLAPNLQVAQVDSRQWAVSARGFNGIIANKLLVMIDGRSVYTPLFSGVFWDAQDVFLPDVDRIEAVSGPGGAAWGANAVNGVINVVTKSAAETQGAYVYGGVGSEDPGRAGVRYGGRAGKLGYFRVYAKTAARGDSVLPDGVEANDGWHFRQGGFRADLQPGENDALTVQGDLYRGRAGTPGPSPTGFSGGNVTASWLHFAASGGQLTTRLYYDETRRDIPFVLGERLRTLDLDTQYEFSPGARHAVVVGAGFRAMLDDVRNSDRLAFLPPELTSHLYSLFAQDTVDLLHGALRLTGAVRGEHNDFSGTDWAPSLRLAWRVAPEHSLWTAVSRAVRSPSRIDRDFFVPVSRPYSIAGGRNFESEKLWAYEVGCRGRLGSKIATTVTSYVHKYYSLRTLEPGPPSVVANGGGATVYGTEVNLDYQIAPDVRWRVGGLLQHRTNHLKPWSRDVNAGRAEGNDPHWQLVSGVSWNPAPRWTVDLNWRWVGRLSSMTDDPAFAVPAYQECDARIGWQAGRDWSVALVGRNLLHDQHREASSFPAPHEIQRAVELVLTWQR